MSHPNILRQYMTPCTSCYSGTKPQRSCVTSTWVLPGKVGYTCQREWSGWPSLTGLSSCRSSLTLVDSTQGLLGLCKGCLQKKHRVRFKFITFRFTVFITGLDLGNDIFWTSAEPPHPTLHAPSMPYIKDGWNHYDISHWFWSFCTFWPLQLHFLELEVTIPEREGGVLSY